MTEPKTILVVDDDSDLRAGLQAVLRKRGFRTLEAEDGLEAKELIAQKRPDLVILDMMMPRRGGFAVLEHFQNKPGAPVFIMITGNEGRKHKAYAEKIGVVDYIRKPFSLDHLLETVEKRLPQAETVETALAKTSAAPAEKPAPFLSFRCASCGARIRAPLRMLGDTRDCPGCKKTILVHPEPPEDAAPMLVDLPAATS